jgi:methyltransferase (TIGR00027 family)
MREREPSRTAFAAASHRAAHQILEGGRIFADRLALPILGLPAHEVTAGPEIDLFRRGMRMFIAARTNFAEAALAAAVAQGGVRQVVVLGAGLDTFAYRSPFGDRVRVFELDHPATQAWKRRRLHDAGIGIPDWLVFAPVDFEREQPLERLQACGFQAEAPSFFTWLGVVPYLTEAAIVATLGMIARLSGPASVVFDYGDPPATLEAGQQAALEKRAAHVAALGEPWLTYFEPAALHERLREIGFTHVTDLGPEGMAARYWPSRAGMRPDRGGHVIWAGKEALLF